MTDHSPAQPDVDALKPCPFCGSEDLTVYKHKTVGIWVACISCGLETPTETGTTPDEATKYWNTRATPTSGEAADVHALAEIWRICDRAGEYSKSKLASAIARIVEDRTKARAAPLKPAPDAMREALKPFAKIADDYDKAHEERVRHYADEGRDFGPPQPDHYLVSISIGECRKARSALSAPMPSPDGARRCSCGPMCQDLGKAGGCRYLQPARALLRRLVDDIWQHATESKVVPSTDVADKLIDASFIAPSDAGAAEPGMVIEEAMWMLQDVPGQTLTERIARLTKWYQDLCAAPPVRGDRAQIAPRKHYFSPREDDGDTCKKCNRNFRDAKYHCINTERPETDEQYIARLEAFVCGALPVQPGAGERE